MPQRLNPILPGNIYHIYNRGINREKIFYSDRNYLFFINQMCKYLSRHCECYAFCLMPNHFHLLLKIEDDQFISKTFQPLMVSYSKAINSEQGRIGPLFQGRFQGNLIEDKIQFLDCLKYVHLNPVQAGLVRSPIEWAHSSYRQYLNARSLTFIHTSVVLEYFEDIQEFRDFNEFGCADSHSRFSDYD